MITLSSLDAPLAPAAIIPAVKRHHRSLPLKVGTRASPLALAQTRGFLALLTKFCPVLRGMEVFEEHAILTTGDKVQDRALSEIGGKGLFAKEIHEALADGRVDFAVHSMKDLETALPPGIILACVLTREDPRDALILGDTCGEPDPADPYACLPRGALIGSSSVRRASQLLAARPDLRITLIRGNVQSRLGKIRDGRCDASLLAMAGLRRLGLEHEASVIIPTDVMVPACGQGIVGVTIRADDPELAELLGGIEDREARIVATCERAFQATLDGSCRTPIGGYAVLEGGAVTLHGLVAREDGGFVLRRSLSGAAEDAARIGVELARSMRADSPGDIYVD